MAYFRSFVALSFGFNRIGLVRSQVQDILGQNTKFRVGDVMQFANEAFLHIIVQIQ